MARSLTLVLPRRPDCPVALLTGAGLDTLAVRVPAQDTALALMRAVGRPVAAPSANRSGQISPTTAASVLEELGGRIDAVLDSGPCQVGLESTVLDLSTGQPTLLRPGGVTVEAIEALIGPVAHAATPAAPAPLPGRGTDTRGSGAVARYAGLALRPLPSGSPARERPASRRSPAGLRSAVADGARITFNLSERGDLTEAAARLFAGLRWLDAEAKGSGQTRIAAMPVPDIGLGRAINDRLRRAAAPR